MNEKHEHKKLAWFGIPKMIPYVRHHVKTLVVLTLVGVLIGILDMASPLFQRYALNHFVGEGTLDTMLIFVLLFVFTKGGAAIATYYSSKMAITTEVTINRDLRAAAFNHLQTLSFSFFNQNSVGYLHSRVMSDTGRIGTAFTWAIQDGVWQMTYLVGAIVVMLIINARLALLILLIVPVITVLFTIFQRHLIAVNREVREINSQITGNFSEGITGAKTIKTLVAEELMEKRFNRDTDRMLERSVKAAHFRGLFAATINLASSIGLAIVLWRGGYIARSEVGTFSMFMSYAQDIMEPVRWLVDFFSELINAQVNIERFTRVMETQPDVKDTAEVIEKYGDTFNPKKENWEELHGDIEFRDVSFMYPDGDEYILEHFNLHIPFGSSIAIVGETGAGKSTLANLICRFYEPTSGQILIDGRDARERSQLWLHSNLGYVLQSPHLFSGSIRENLLYGNENATEEQINEALKLVSADAVIERLEDGLETDVGEGGGMLSTGEKQLISFARAILADPKILVLDEATASVDTVTEQKIQSAINTIISGRTSIVIAHRLSTIRNSDMILVVKDGKIIESGKHDELMKERGHYYNLYTRQFEDEATAQLMEKLSAAGN